MPPSNRLERVACFVDALYLDGVCRHFKTDKKGAGSRGILTALRESLVQNRTMGLCHYYDWRTEQEAIARLDQMEEWDYFRVHRLKRWREPDSEKDSGRAAIVFALSMDMIEYAWRDMCDRTVLVAGSQAFVDVVRRVQASGKLVDVAGYYESIDEGLRKTADTLIWLTEEHFITKAKKS